MPSAVALLNSPAFPAYFFDNDLDSSSHTCPFFSRMLKKSAARLVHLVYSVCLVYLVYLVSSSCFKVHVASFYLQVFGVVS